MKAIGVGMALAVGLASAAALAQPAVVEAVQYPAWLERGGNAVPLSPGTSLQAKDRLRTGSNARVQLRLGEGSAVKLGENTQFIVEKVEDRERGLFRATLDVISGAFRFTSDVARRSRPREISIKVKNVTAGIRGTDVWGKTTDERDLVCLLEGKVSVGSEGHPTVTLDQPRDFYQRPRGGAPALGKVDPKQIEDWSRETEVSRDGPAARVGGGWRVTVAAFAKRDEALDLNRRLRAGGYPSVVVATDVAVMVEVQGLAGELEARAVVANLRNVKGVILPAVNGPGTR